MRGHGTRDERHWLAEAQVVVVRTAACRSTAEGTALREGVHGPATATALTGALAEGIAERDINEALDMVPSLAGDDAQGKALAAIVAAAARAGDTRTLPLMEDFRQWEDSAWYDVKADTAARAAAALATSDPPAAARLIEIAARDVGNAYGDWKPIADALECLLTVHDDGERLIDNVVDTLRDRSGSSEPEQLSLLARAIAHRSPARALAYEHDLDKQPAYYARVLGAVAATQTGERRDALLAEACEQSQDAEAEWQQLDLLVEIAEQIATVLPAQARALAEQIAEEARALGGSHLLATYLSQAAAIRIRLDDQEEAVQWLEDACAALASTSGGDGEDAMVVILRVLSDAPPPILERTLPALLEAAQTADDVILRQIESLLPLVLRVQPEPLPAYLDELQIAEESVNASFVP